MLREPDGAAAIGRNRVASVTMGEVTTLPWVFK